MVRKTSIEDLLERVQLNPKDSTEFLLGQICTDISSIKEDNKAMASDIEKLKQQSWVAKGIILCSSFGGGVAGSKLLSLLS